MFHILLTVALLPFALGVNWHEESTLFWGEYCDWVGNDIAELSIPGSQCGPTCVSNPSCTHFSWRNVNSPQGTCWLKSGQVSLGQAQPYNQYSVCGVLKSGLPPPTPPSNLSACATDGWRLKKNYDFSSRDSIFREWDVLTWPAYKVNSEKQSYGTSDQNLYSRNNHGIIKVVKTGADSFTSARLESKDTYTPVNSPGKKLRVEFTGKVPTVPGAWPAYWLLGDMSTYGGWPLCGEIDVMEWVQMISGKSQSTIHYRWSGNEAFRTIDISAQEMASSYITYGVEYSTAVGDEYLLYYIRRPNGQVVTTQKIERGEWADFSTDKCPAGTKPNQFPCGPAAPFDNRHHLIVNFAVGGVWGGVGVSDYSAFNNGVEFDTQSVQVCEKL